MFTFLGQVDPFPSQQLQRRLKLPRNERSKPRGVDADPVYPVPVRPIEEGLAQQLVQVFTRRRIALDGRLDVEKKAIPDQVGIGAAEYRGIELRAKVEGCTEMRKQVFLCKVVHFLNCRKASS